MTRWASPDLITAAIQGDDTARSHLIAAIWPACFRLAASLIGDYGLAQDAAQEACVIVHRKVAELREARAFDSWLYRIVARESSRLRKRFQSSSTPLYERGFSADSAASVDVWRALATLSPSLRDVTVLFYFDDLTTEEIAHALGVPHATVRTRLLRARERLRAVLGEGYDCAPSAVHTKEVTQHAC
jgi:RNA polymerase sigma-70 factor (ECF subfamily)